MSDLREERDAIVVGDRAAAGLRNEAIDPLGAIAARVVVGQARTLTDDSEPCSFCPYQAIDLDDLYDHLGLVHGMVDSDG